MCADNVPERIIADPQRIRQVLVNLVGNAVKFTLHGSIDIRLSAQNNGELQCQVEDSGIGIPHDKLDAIFNAFTQADGSISRKYGGAGLGLAISARLLKMMNGSIQVQSEEGRGAVFEFVSPVSPLLRLEN